MGVPSRAARLAHAGRYCELWNAGRKDEWVASWRTIVQGEVTMFDPVGTKPKHGFDVAMSRAFDQFQPVTELHMVTVKANGPEMAWVIDNRFRTGDRVLTSLSIETFRWDEQGDLVIKTYYDMPASVGDDDDPYELLLGSEGAAG